MRAVVRKRLQAEVAEAVRLDARISKNKLWRKVVDEYYKTPGPMREHFTIFQVDSVRE